MLYVPIGIPKGLYRPLNVLLYNYKPWIWALSLSFYC